MATIATSVIRPAGKPGSQLCATRDNAVKLVEQLVEYVRETMADSAEDDVLLDVAMGDVRCVVIRIPQEIGGINRIPLSPREIEIARMVAKGLPNKTIAAVLDISTWTVGTHMRRVFAKLGVGSRAAMVARLAQSGDFEHPKKDSHFIRSGRPQEIVAGRDD